VEVFTFGQKQGREVEQQRAETIPLLSDASGTLRKIFFQVRELCMSTN